MNTPKFTDVLQDILARDSRYNAEAYTFVREGLEFTVRQLESPRHISGQELLQGIREYALEEFGPVTQTVLKQWGVLCTEDIGEIVFNMVEAGLLGKTEKDNRSDFLNGYNFDEAFRKPFRPASAAHRQR